MTAIIGMTEAQVMTALRSFLLSVLPDGTEVVKGLDNRVPEPTSDNFVVMWPILRERLATNVSSYSDLSNPEYQINQDLQAEFTQGVIETEAGTAVEAESITLYHPGFRNAEQSTKFTVQVDVHGPLSGDNVQTITTLFRDEYGCDFFRYGLNIDTDAGVLENETGTALLTEPIDVQPLYASEPRQLPFLNGSQQVEQRWSVDLVMQANILVTTRIQFIEELTVTLQNVDTLPIT